MGGDRIVLGAIIISLCLLGVSAIMISPAHAWTKLIGLTLLCAMACCHWRSVVIRHALGTLTLHGDGRTRFRDLTGHQEDGRFEGAGWVSPWLSVLKIGSERGEVRRVVIMPQDQLPGAYRRMITWLRLGRFGPED